MKARTLGPALMIAFGVVTLASPTYSSISAAVVDPCTAPQAGIDPCCLSETAGAVDPCVIEPEVTSAPTTAPASTTTTTTGGEGSGAGLPDAGSDSTATIALGVSLVVGGAALLVSTRRRPKAAA